MAYIPEEEEQSGESTQIYGSGSDQAQDATTAPETPSGAVSGTIGTQPTSQPTSAQKPQKPRGSGLFKDIRKYIKANQPAAQRMSTAAQQKFGSQAGQIGEQVRKKEQDFQRKLTEQQTGLEKSKQFGQQQLESALGGGSLASQDVGRFRDILEGREKYESTGQLGVSSERSRAAQLGRQAEAAGTAQGARQLLKETFQPQGQYTRGQQSLDELILGSDVAARRGLTEGVRGTSEQLGGDIKTARMGALQQASELSQAGKDSREALQAQLQTGLTGSEEEVRAAEVASRAAAEKLKGLETAYGKSFEQLQKDIGYGMDVGGGDIGHLRNVIWAGKGGELQGGVRQAQAYKLLGDKEKLTQLAAGGFDPYTATTHGRRDIVARNIQDLFGQVSGKDAQALQEALMAEQGLSGQTAKSLEEQVRLGSGLSDTQAAKYQALADLSALQQPERLFTQSDLAGATQLSDLQKAVKAYEGRGIYDPTDETRSLGELEKINADPNLSYVQKRSQIFDKLLKQYK